MKQSRSVRVLFASLTNSELAGLAGDADHLPHSKLFPQNDDLAIGRLKKEIQDLSNKNLDCETLSKQIRATETAIIELEKSISCQVVQTRQSREKLLHELATARTKLASQKRKLAELENELGHVESCAADIKARLEARTNCSDHSKTQLKATQELGKHKSLENKQIESVKEERQGAKRELQSKLDQANARLGACIRLAEAQGKECENKRVQKRTMEESLRRLSEEIEALKKTSQAITEETKATDQRASEFVGQIGEIQRKCHAEEVRAQEIRGEAFVFGKKLEKKAALTAQAENRMKTLANGLSVEENALRCHANRLDSVQTGIEAKENQLARFGEGVKEVAQKRAAVEAWGRDVVAEMQALVKCDNGVKNLLNAERIFARRDM